MAALGHKRPLSAILAQCPLPGVKRPFGPIDIWHHFERCGNSSVMSAFPESGHSDKLETAEMKGRFRPGADTQMADLEDNYLH